MENSLFWYSFLFHYTFTTGKEMVAYEDKTTCIHSFYENEKKKKIDISECGLLG